MKRENELKNDERQVRENKRQTAGKSRENELKNY